MINHIGTCFGAFLALLIFASFRDYPTILSSCSSSKVSIRNAELLQYACNTQDTVYITGKKIIGLTIHITKPTIIVGDGELVFDKDLAVCFSIESSDVYLKGLSFITSSFKSDLLQASGTQNNPLKMITIDSCRFEGGKNAINWDYVNNSTIAHCNIKDVEYYGIGIHSCCHVDIICNTIKNINLRHRQKNSYGVAATFHYGHSKSTDIRINENIVENNPYWEALDTHGGENIEFCRNIIRNCWRGVAAVSNYYNNVYMICRNISIISNDIICSDEPLSNGVVFASEDADHLSYGWYIKGNVIRNAVLGFYSTYSSGAIVINNSIDAIDEGWQDWGSRDITFQYNTININGKGKPEYKRCGIYLIPVGKNSSFRFGKICNNSINSQEYEGIMLRDRFKYQVLLNNNVINTKTIGYGVDE